MGRASFINNCSLSNSTTDWSTQIQSADFDAMQTNDNNLQMAENFRIMTTLTKIDKFFTSKTVSKTGGWLTVNSLV